MNGLYEINASNDFGWSEFITFIIIFYGHWYESHVIAADRVMASHCVWPTSIVVVFIMQYVLKMTFKSLANGKISKGIFLVEFYEPNNNRKL